MLKKVFTLLLCLTMVLSLAACTGTAAPEAPEQVAPTTEPTDEPVAEPVADPEAKFTAGTYTGSAQGFGGVLTVEVVLSDEAIESVTVTESSETQGIGSNATDRLPGEIVASQSVAVDAISGATVSSDAVIEAVTAALASAGVDAAALVPTVEGGAEAGEKTLECDVVIIGAGGAGMTAAIVAADAGKSVVILEKTAMTGGNTSRSTGGMNAAATKEQATVEFAETAGVEKTLSTAAESYPELAELVDTVSAQYEAYKANPTGYFDSAELYMLDTLVGGKNLNDHAIVQTLALNAASGIEWLHSIGADLTSVGSFGGASVKRIHRPVNAEGKTVSVGAYIVPILQQACESRGVQIVYEAPATELIVTDGAVTGVKAAGWTVSAKSVVIASGGFGANLEMVASYQPSLNGFVTTNAPGAMGDGIAMATEIGAATVDMDQIQIHPTVEQSTSGLITEGLRGDGAILVNAEGKRFTDEVGTRDVVSAAEIAQTGGYAYLIVDQAMVDKSAVIGGYITKGYTVQGDTYADLATAMGVDGAALTETMDKWNAAVEAGTDAEFGRTSFASPLATAPFYAIKVAPGIHHTMGGLKIDTDTRVLDEAGNPIANLFAAGEVTGGVHGANRLGGNAVADIVVFGRIAGAKAAENAK